MLKGLLVIAGRTNAVLNIGGDKVNPEVVENLLAGIDGIEQAAAFSVSDELGNGVLWAAIVGQLARNEDELRLHCERQLGKMYAPVHFRTVAQIPMNEGGKIDRPRLMALARTPEAG
jgi:acyl-CoA synthetase (AMP-forming)/AMP-acid ligase II